MKLEIEVIKITAIGCNLRLATLLHTDKHTTMITSVRISNDVYQYLKSKGVPTAQKLYAERIKTTEIKSKQD